jgi:hypothetical protein
VGTSLALEGGEYIGEDEGRKEVDCSCYTQKDDGMVGRNIIAIIIVVSERI